MNNFKYCPYCKEKLTNNKNYYQCNSCKKTIYKHPALTGSAFIVKDKKVLLVKRGIEPFKGLWDAAGGFLNYGEMPEKGTIRELKEEMKVDVKIITLLGIYPDRYTFQNLTFKTLNFIYIAEITKGIIKAQDDIESVKWFDLDELPKNEIIAFECERKALVDLIKFEINSIY